MDPVLHELKLFMELMSRIKNCPKFYVKIEEKQFKQEFKLFREII